MAVEFHDDSMDAAADISDAEAFSSVILVLEAVCTDANLIAQEDREQYDNLLNIVEPSKRMSPDEEALLVMVLKALSGAVFKIERKYHSMLLSNIFSMCIWNYGPDARDALVELITSLAAVPYKYLEDCLDMLVGNFIPPRRLRENISQSRWLMRKHEVHNELRMAFCHITKLVPLAPKMLKDIIDRRAPRYTDPKDMIVIFVDCMLGLEINEIGEFLGSVLLGKVVELLTDLDVNITWEDILHEDHNKGIFDMELEDDANKPPENDGLLKGNAFADKLDSLIVVICQHLNCWSDAGHLLKVFETLSVIFRRTVLKLHKSKFTQFVMFYACSLDPEVCGEKFALLLSDTFISKIEDPNSRMKAVAYLASYLARAKFVSTSLVACILERLADWCCEYCQNQNTRELKVKHEAHGLFYSGCQALMYILCFRMRSIMDVPHLKSLLFHMPLNLIMSHPLDPLKVCLPSIVHEFLRQAKAAHLLDISVPTSYHKLDSEFSKAYGGIERLDMFFPFDPYMLKESDRFMRPHFEFWSMVKTTYSSCNSEDEEDYDDLDAPDFTSNAHSYEGHEDIEVETASDDDLDYSLNKMSITPKPAAKLKMDSVLNNPSQMPARIRPSVSPPW